MQAFRTTNYRMTPTSCIHTPRTLFNFQNISLFSIRSSPNIVLEEQNPQPNIECNKAGLVKRRDRVQLKGRRAKTWYEQQREDSRRAEAPTPPAAVAPWSSNYPSLLLAVVALPLPLPLAFRVSLRQLRR